MTGRPFEEQRRGRPGGRSGSRQGGRAVGAADKPRPEPGQRIRRNLQARRRMNAALASIRNTLIERENAEEVEFALDLLVEELEALADGTRNPGDVAARLGGGGRGH